MCQSLDLFKVYRKLSVSETGIQHSGVSPQTVSARVSFHVICSYLSPFLKKETPKQCSLLKYCVIFYLRAATAFPACVMSDGTCLRYFHIAPILFYCCILILSRIMSEPVCRLLSITIDHTKKQLSHLLQKLLHIF